MSNATLKQDIDDAFNKVFGAGHGISPSLTGKAAAKLYEIKILAELLTRLNSSKKFKFNLVNPTAGFKGSPGPVNNSYTYIQVLKGRRHIADIRTDTEFVGLSSYSLAGHSVPIYSGEYHELDIMVCEKDLAHHSRPTSAQVYIGVECKHWAGIPKKLLREILGVRRELSFYNATKQWPPVSLGLGVKRSNPGSELIFSASKGTSRGVKNIQTEWKIPTDQFEIAVWVIPV